MRADVRRGVVGAALGCSAWCLAWWPHPAEAQRTDERVRSGEPTSTQRRQPPLAIRNVATTLRTMGRGDVADRFLSDFQRGRILLDDPGGRARTGPPVIIPGVTNRTHNRMELEQQQLEVECNTRQTDKNPVQDGTIGWALTVMHEYVHMEQDNPQQTPRYENAGWYEAIHENQSWMHRVMGQTSQAENLPDSPEKIARLQELSRQLMLLAGQHDVTINDLRAEIAAGHVGGTDFPTLNGSSTTDPEAVRRSVRTLVTRHIENTNQTIARVQRNLAGGRSTGTSTGATTGATTSANAGSADRKPKKKSIFDKITDAAKKADKLIADADKALNSGQKQSPASGADAAGSPAATTSATASSARAGSTSLTLELPGFWGHLNYTISGAQLDAPSGGDRGKVAGRSYTGKLVNGTLTISGVAVSDNPSSGPGSGDYYELIVEVKVGKEQKYFGYIAQKDEKLNKPFSLSVPVSATATSGTFSISLLEQNRNYGTYGWVVSGSLTR